MLNTFDDLEIENVIRWESEKTRGGRISYLQRAYEILAQRPTENKQAIKRVKGLIEDEIRAIQDMATGS